MASPSQRGRLNSLCLPSSTTSAVDVQILRSDDDLELKPANGDPSASFCMSCRE